MSITKKPSIYFVATQFGDIHHGPAIYTQNLWNLFRDSADFDFHMVVLNSRVEHERIHVHSSQSLARKNFYRRLDTHIRQVIPANEHVLLHANAAHLIAPETAASYRTIVQINDTEVSQHRFSILGWKQYGIRRTIALAWRRKREQEVARRSELTICNSNFTAATVMNQYNLGADDVKRIYKAVDLVPFLRMVPVNQNPDQVKLVLIGNNWKRKGLSVLIDAVRHLKNSSREQVFNLDVYGQPDSKTQTYFQTLTRQKDLNDRINFKGLLSRAQAPDALATSTILVLPSFEEALGLVAIEALATGIPVVGSRIGGIPEIINHEQLGTLVEPGDAMALAEAIKTRSQQPLSIQAVQFRKQSSQRFSLDALRNNLTQVYDQLLTNR